MRVHEHQEKLYKVTVSGMSAEKAREVVFFLRAMTNYTVDMVACD